MYVLFQSKSENTVLRCFPHVEYHLEQPVLYQSQPVLNSRDQYYTGKIPFFMEDVKLHNLQYCHIHYTGLYCHVFQLSPIIGVGQSDSLRASFLNIHIFCVLLNKYWRRAIFQHYPHIQLRELYVPGHFFSKGLLQCLPK